MEVSSQSHKSRFDSFEVDLRAGEIHKCGIRLKLQDQPFRVLALLLERPGEVATREELRQRLWPADTFVDFDTGLNSAIKKLRDVLGDSAEKPRYIETLPRRGYRFIGSLELPPAQSPQTTSSALAGGKQVADASSIAPDPASETSHGRFRLVFALALVVGTLTLAAFFAFAPHGRSGGLPGPIRSIAVLPLQNLSGDPAQGYFADGMTEEIIGRLSSIRGLRVVSRTSVMQFKDSRLSAPQIAKALGVDALVEGSVIRDGGRVRVHAQLIRAATDEHFWSETYDRELEDVLGLQSDVAQSVARKVEVTVTGEEHNRIVATRQVSPEVYESYLKGQFGSNNNRAEVEQNISYFEDAIRQDPTFAPAYVGLGNAYNNLAAVFVGGPPIQLRFKMIDVASKAIALDPQLADAHVLLATGLQKLWRWDQSEAEYRKALEISPNSASAHKGLADWLLCQGRTEEALAWARRARELDPLGDSGATIAWIQFHARRYDESLREFHSFLALHPDNGMALWQSGFVLVSKGQYQQAISVFEKTAAMTNRNPGSIELLAAAHGFAGHRAEALRLIDELTRRRKTGYVPAGVFINPYFGLRDYDQAFIGFEMAYREKSGILQLLKVHPFFDPVRGDPRFADLLRRVGLASGS